MREVELVFFKGRRGDIISRLPSGKVAVVNRRATKVPREGEKWLCWIDFEKPNFAVVTPIKKFVKKTKEVKVYHEFTCGHRILKWTDKKEVEVLEGEAVIPEVRVYKVPELCEECLRRKQETCKHKMTELTMTGSWITVTCEECGKELLCIERPFELNEEVIKETAKKIRELAGEEKEREFREFIEKLREYKEKTQQIRELEKRLDDIFEEIQRTLGEIKFTKWIYSREPESTEFIKVPMFSEAFGGGVEFKWIKVDREAREKLKRLSEEFVKVRERIRKLEEETPKIRFE